MPRRRAPGPPHGFTLVELLVVVVIIGLLAAIALPRFLGQRTRAKNAAAQAAVRHALVAARSYYTQNSESYVGLGPAQLQGYESSLSGTEPADNQQPGPSANPQDIWIGNGLSSTNPNTVAAGDPNAGSTVTLCSVSKGDAIYCVRDADGVASYLQTAGASVITSAGGTFSAGGWSSSTGSTTTVYSALSSWSGSTARHACALSAGSVLCWGDNTHGGLGVSPTSLTDRATPAAVSGISGATGLAVALDSGCALFADGSAKCWGYNSSGQLGNGSATDSPSPVTVTGLSGATQISGGSANYCVLLSGSVSCWGANTYGELGDGTATRRYAPTAVSGLGGTTVTQIALGWNHSCALISDGTVRCWGYNAFNQLGDGSTTNRLSAVAVSGLSGAIQVAGGAYHTCALMQDRTVRCWGRNIEGALGDGSTTQRSSPVAVSGLSGVSSLDAGSLHTCAVLQDGSVRCWGRNYEGQLGDGSSSHSSCGGLDCALSPVQASGISGAVAIDVGDRSSCALLGSGSIRCWGAGVVNGQSSGSNTPSTLPG